eukprot:9098526-Lingulodinium_polyedra.AAC.1
MAYVPLSGPTPSAPCGPSSREELITRPTSTSALPGPSTSVPFPQNACGRPSEGQSTILPLRRLTLQAVGPPTCP